MPKSLIFKQPCLDSSKKRNDSFSRFARDWAGHEFLSQVKSKELSVPQFYGGSIKHQFIFLEDLGEHHESLVDYLSNDNKNHAIDALHRFMKCLGQLHTSGYGKTDLYFNILRKLNPDMASCQEDLKMTFATLVPELKSAFKIFSISQSENLWSEINMVIKSCLEPGLFTTFIHGDNCPDNVFKNPDKDELYLIDFECGTVRSALLDATYLRMSMPTCWYSNAIPEDLINSLETTYREELIKKIPAAKDNEAYHTAYTNACAFWMLYIIAEVEKFMFKDIYNSGSISEKCFSKSDKNSGRSRTLSRLQAFVCISKKNDKLLHLRSAAEEILEKLKSMWPNAKPLDFYPVFREKKPFSKKEKT
ncbi:MAG: phosphotransferase [Alphaproteobacteria bacterium]|nr:phosphotransferase [Alphaproteobacteria bacterium]